MRDLVVVKFQLPQAGETVQVFYFLDEIPAQTDGLDAAQGVQVFNLGNPTVV